MIVELYDSHSEGLLLACIRSPIMNDSTTRLVAVDVKATFIPIFGMKIKRITTNNKGATINFEQKTMCLSEQYEGTTVFVLIELSKTGQYDPIVSVDEVLMAINVTYYDVSKTESINIVKNSSMTMDTNHFYETLIRGIKSNNRPKIKPCSDIEYYNDNMDDMGLFDT